MGNKLFNQIFDDEYSTGDSVRDSLGMKFLNKISEGKVAKRPIDIGDGFYARRVGFDINGNWSYWIQRGANKAKKIQALNIDAGNNKITDVDDFTNPEYSHTVELIKDYFNKYLTKPNTLAEADYRVKHYYYIIDLNERGYFSAHVEDTEGNIVYEISNDDSEDGSLWIVEDGFMRHIDDTKGLEEYLKSLDVIPEYAELFHEKEVGDRRIDFDKRKSYEKGDYYIDESIESNVLMSAKLENIPETLSYNVDELFVNSQNGSFRIPNAGILSLEIDEEELVRKLMENSNESVVQVNDIKIEQPPTKFKLNGDNFQGNYKISVRYTSDNGDQEERSLNFDDLSFSNADKLLSIINNPKDKTV